MQTTENAKKAVRLEDKLAEAEAKLAEAEKALAVKKREISNELVEAQRKERAADAALAAAHRAHDAAQSETRKRLGLTPAAAKKAVLAWAGIKPGEEDEAVIRGETRILDDAISRIVASVVDSDPKVVATKKEINVAEHARSPLRRHVRDLEHSTWLLEREVRNHQDTIRELSDKIGARDAVKARESDEPRKQVSKEDKARFVEARRRLTVAATGREHGAWPRAWDDEKKTKLDPPFVWPPKDK